MDRSRSRKKDKHKHKDKHKDKDKKEKNEKKEKKEKTKTKMKTKEFNAAADKSENWNTDKVEQGTKQQEIGKEIIEMIQKEREEDKRSYEEWMVRKGYSTTRVKQPLNIYEELMKKNIVKPHQQVNPSLLNNPIAPRMIEVIVNDRMGRKERIKCCPQDSVGDFKKLISAKTGTRPEKIRLQRQHQVLKDHISLDDYEVKQEMALEMYYN